MNCSMEKYLIDNSKLLQSMIHKRGVPRQDTEDVYNNLFINLLQYASDDIDEGDIPPYVVQSLKGFVIQYKLQEAKLTKLDGQVGSDKNVDYTFDQLYDDYQDSKDPLELLLNQEEKDTLLQEIEGISNERHSNFLSMICKDISLRTSAEHAGLSYGAAKVVFSRFTNRNKEEKVNVDS